MTRLDDALERLEKKPTDPDYGYITPADIAAAFRDLYQMSQDLMLIKQDQLPVNGGDGEVLTLENYMWVAKPLPPVTGGGVTGVLTGAGSPLPQTPVAGALYLVGTDVPTAVTNVIPNAKTGDMITWDGTAWIHTGAGGGLPVPIPGGPLDVGKSLVVNAGGTGAVWVHPSGILVGTGMPPTNPVPNLGDWFFDVNGQNLYTFAHTQTGNAWQLVSGMEDFGEMFNGGNVPAPYDSTRAYPTRAVVESAGLFYMATEPVNAGEGAGTSPKWLQLSLDGLQARSVPKGGTVGQVLVKQSATDFDAQWDDLSALLPGVTHFRGTVADLAALNALQNVNPGDVAITIDNGHMHVYAQGAWDDIGPAAGNTLPAVGNAGDILTVVNGVPTWVHPVAATGGTGIPVGGSAGQVLAKVDGTDGNVHWVDTTTLVPAARMVPTTAGAADAGKILGVSPQGNIVWVAPSDMTSPVGGTAGQVLAKRTNTDHDVVWIDAPAGGGIPKGNLSGAATALPTGPATGDTYTITAPVPTAITNAVPGVQAGDSIRWDGTKWVRVPAPHELPVGGTAGQVLAKIDAVDRHVEWVTPASPVSSFKGSVADAAALPATAAIGDVYVTLDDGHIHIVTNAGPPATYDNIGPAVGGGTGNLPAVGTNGQVLTVVGGAAAWAAVPTELPAHGVGDAGKSLYVTPAGGLQWEAGAAAVGGASIILAEGSSPTPSRLEKVYTNYSPGPITVMAKVLILQHDYPAGIWAYDSSNTEIAGGAGIDTLVVTLPPGGYIKTGAITGSNGDASFDFVVTQVVDRRRVRGLSAPSTQDPAAACPGDVYPALGPGQTVANTFHPYAPYGMEPADQVWTASEFMTVGGTQYRWDGTQWV